MNIDANLDGMNIDELYLIAGVFDLLGQYARIKLVAMNYREQGDISRALVLERECERLYSRLPEFYRW